jgi:predicted AAA+ superfamily ATPase
MAGQFPALLVTGTRQAGKTSLLRHLFPKASYLTLDLPSNAEAAKSAPEALLDRYPEPVIIDEIQYAPVFLRHLKVRIDQDRSPGRFLLTGSQVFELMQGISESLAGRCGVLSLLTLSYDELEAAGRSLTETSYIFLGGYPELHIGAEPELWFPAYVATYLERDVRNILRVVDLQDFNRFIRACALRTGQVLNYSDIARDVGIAPNTARKWLNLLQTSGVVALLEPFFGNRTKRLIKSPKLMFLDTGLAAYLCGFLSERELFGSSYAGAFWESHVFGQVFRRCVSLGRRLPLYYWRTVSGHEVDLVIELSPDSIMAVEVKWKEQPDMSDTSGLRALASAEGARKVESFIVAGTTVGYNLTDGTWVTDVKGLLETLSRKLS